MGTPCRRVPSSTTGNERLLTPLSGSCRNLIPLLSSWEGRPPLAVRWRKNCAGPMSEVVFGGGLRVNGAPGSVILQLPVFRKRESIWRPKELPPLTGYCCSWVTTAIGCPCFRVPLSTIGKERRLTPSGSSGSCRNLIPLDSMWEGRQPVAVRWRKN